MRKMILLVVTMLFAVIAAPAAPQDAAKKDSPPKPAKGLSQAVLEQWNDVGRKLITMAEDFPEDKYQFRLKPEMRSFGDVIVHIASGNVYGAKAGRGEKALSAGGEGKSLYRSCLGGAAKSRSTQQVDETVLHGFTRTLTPASV